MPPSEHAAAAAAAPQDPLLGLPEELLHLVADALLHKHLPSVLRLSQASTALRGRLAAVRAAAEARRLRWVAEMTNTNKIGISDEGRALTKVPGPGGYRYAWAAGSLLPTVGRVSFSVRIERSRDFYNDGLGMNIGVCTADNTHAWGFHPYDGQLWRFARDADGRVRYGHERAPPANYPDADGTQVMRNEAGKRANLKGRYC